MSLLLTLAYNHFGNLTAAEAKVIQAATAGQFAICGPNANDSDLANYPGTADSWGASREIRMEIIRWLFVNKEARQHVDPQGISVYGAKMIGVLDLCQVRAEFPLALISCRITREMLLRAVEIPMLSFDRSWTRAVKADGAEVSGGVTLRNGFRAEEMVRFHRARIGVDLDCSNGTFINPVRPGNDETGTALGADGATFGGGVLLNKGFHAEGEVRFSRANIRGDLDCSEATFHNCIVVKGVAIRGVSLNADGINVAGGIFLRQIHAEGEVRLPRAKTGGDLDCGGASIVNTYPSNATAMNVEGSVIGGSLVLNKQFHAKGAVSARGAKIAGQLDCVGGKFESRPQKGVSETKPALDLSVADVASGAFLAAPFSSEGEVRMQAARIGTNLQCNGGVFNNPPVDDVVDSGQALTADGITVTGSVLLGQKFWAHGEVRLLNSRIAGDLDCSDGNFDNAQTSGRATSGHALSAHTTTVEGNVYLRHGFCAQGEVSFSGATIGGKLEGTAGEIRGELNLESASVNGALMLANIVNPRGMELNLINASVRALADDDSSWPEQGKLFLDGFTYQRFSGPATKDAHNRLRWLSKQRDFAQGPFRQLARVLRDEGDDEGSRRVKFEMERQRRAREHSSRYMRARDSILRFTIGYGYYPRAALLWLAAIVLVGAALYFIGFCAGSMTPIDAQAYAVFKTCHVSPPYYERFHSLIYSIESGVPFLKLGQVDRWQPDPNPTRFVWQIPVVPNRFVVWVSFAGLIRWCRWLQVMSGWLLGTLFIAGVTGIIRNE